MCNSAYVACGLRKPCLGSSDYTLDKPLPFRHACMQDIHVPREVVWLNGAPGAGKVCCRGGRNRAFWLLRLPVCLQQAPSCILHARLACSSQVTISCLSGSPPPLQGVNTSHIMKTRGLDSCLCISDLLVRSSKNAASSGVDRVFCPCRTPCPAPTAVVDDMFKPLGVMLIVQDTPACHDIITSMLLINL